MQEIGVRFRRFDRRWLSAYVVLALVLGAMTYLILRSDVAAPTRGSPSAGVPPRTADKEAITPPGPVLSPQHMQKTTSTATSEAKGTGASIAVQILGTVVDEFGDGLGSGQVHVHVPTSSPDHPASNSVVSVNPDGSFRAEVEIYASTRLTLAYSDDAGRYAPHTGIPAAYAAGASPLRVQLVAQRLQATRVVVVDPDAVPAPNCRISLVPNPRFFMGTDPAVTDERGIAQIDAPIGFVRFEATAPTGSWGAGYFLVRSDIQETHTIALRRPTARVSVRCTSEGIAELGGLHAKVQVWGPARRHELDLVVDGEAGQINLHGENGGLRARVVLGDGQKMEFRWESLKGAIQRGELLLPVGQRSTLTMRLVSARGLPLPDLGVYAVRESRSESDPSAERRRVSARTNSDGVAVFHGVPFGSYEFMAMPVAYAGDRAEATQNPQLERRALTFGEVHVSSRKTDSSFVLPDACVLRGTYDGPRGPSAKPVTLTVRFPRASRGRVVEQAVKVRIASDPHWCVALPVPCGTPVSVRPDHLIGSEGIEAKGTAGGSPIRLCVPNKNCRERTFNVRKGRHLRPFGWIQLRPTSHVEKPTHGYAISTSSARFRSHPLPPGHYAVYFCESGPTGAYLRVARDITIEEDDDFVEIDVAGLR